MEVLPKVNFEIPVIQIASRQVNLYDQPPGIDGRYLVGLLIGHESSGLREQMEAEGGLSSKPKQILFDPLEKPRQVIYKEFANIAFLVYEDTEEILLRLTLLDCAPYGPNILVESILNLMIDCAAGIDTHALIDSVKADKFLGRELSFSQHDDNKEAPGNGSAWFIPPALADFVPFREFEKRNTQRFNDFRFTRLCQRLSQEKYI